jgi:hypothetical protein
MNGMKPAYETQVRIADWHGALTAESHCVTIAGVFLMRPGVEVRGIDAAFHVAGVTHDFSVWYLTKSDRVGHAMTQVRLPVN